MQAADARQRTRSARKILITWLTVTGALLVAVGLFPAGTVLGAPHTDLVGQFIPWRAFAADSLRSGDFPLWNPHTYSGQPFLGGFQSALLYPLNLVFVFLPLERALNFSVLLHLVILGWGMAHWVSQRGLHPVAACVMGIVLALSGAVFPHVYAGHLSNLCTMAWAPWAFAGLEAWSRERRVAGLLLASAAIALQILAGQIQYVFFFGVAAGLHAVVASIFDPAVRKRALLGVALACAAAAMLSAAQVLPGLEAAAEGVRQGKVDYRFASAFALPPENLLTAIAPGFFGDADRGTHPYWGRCYPWEMSVYFSVCGVIFATAALWDRERGREARRDLLVASLLVVLALGRHLPLYAFLYEHVPGFGQFRGMSKFTFPAMLFVLLAGAAGLDGFLRGRWNAKRVGSIALCVSVGLAGVGWWVSRQPAIAEGIFAWIKANANDDIIPPPTFPTGAAAHAGWSLLRAAALCLLAGGCILLARIRPAWRWGVVALLPLELFDFASRHLATTPVSLALPTELREFVAAHPGDYRVLNLARPNAGHLLGAPDLWGNDPMVLKRYAEFMTFTQGGNPDEATQNLNFTSIPRLYAMLRCRYAFVPSATGVNVVDVPNPLPRVLLVSDYQVHAQRDAVFAALNQSDFDPGRLVMLETEPSPRPQPATTAGRVQIVAASTDTLTIEAEVTSPTLLLITDLYSRGWKVRTLETPAQSRYEILPANYILQAVPLAAGRHHLRLEYRPETLNLGVALSSMAWLIWIGGVILVHRRRRVSAVV